MRKFTFDLHCIQAYKGCHCQVCVSITFVMFVQRRLKPDGYPDRPRGSPYSWSEVSSVWFPRTGRLLMSGARSESVQD